MIRLEEVPFELDGKKYLLRCNMNVLADVQDAMGGDFGAALDPGCAFSSLMIFLAAMLNDYAEEMGWEERFSPRALGRMLPKHAVPADVIMGLVVRSMAAPAEDPVSDLDTKAPDEGN